MCATAAAIAFIHARGNSWRPGPDQGGFAGAEDTYPVCLLVAACARVSSHAHLRSLRATSREGGRSVRLVRHAEMELPACSGTLRPRTGHGRRPAAPGSSKRFMSRPCGIPAPHRAPGSGAPKSPAAPKDPQTPLTLSATAPLPRAPAPAPTTPPTGNPRPYSAQSACGVPRARAKPAAGTRARLTESLARSLT